MTCFHGLVNICSTFYNKALSEKKHCLLCRASILTKMGCNCLTLLILICLLILNCNGMPVEEENDCFGTLKIKYANGDSER